MGKRLEGKIAIITGANSGVGEATARLFAAEGAKVAIAARREEALAEIEARITAAGGTAFSVTADVNREADVAKLFADTAAKFGKIDILVNCAGIMDGINSITRTSDELAMRLFETNTMGTMRCMREAIKYMRSNGGAIVNVASVAGLFGHGGAAYSMSKGGVVALTKCVALEYHLKGIRVNVVCPGGIDSPMLGKAGEIDMDMVMDLMAHKMDGTPQSTPEEQANIILFLASDESAAISGQAIISDHGSTL